MLGLQPMADEYQTEVDRIRSLTGYQDILPAVEEYNKASMSSAQRVKDILASAGADEKSTLPEKIIAGLGGLAYLADMGRKRKPQGNTERAAYLAQLLKGRRDERKANRLETTKNLLTAEQIDQETRGRGFEALTKAVMEGNRQKAETAATTLSQLNNKRMQERYDAQLGEQKRQFDENQKIVNKQLEAANVGDPKATALAAMMDKVSNLPHMKLKARLAEEAAKAGDFDKAEKYMGEIDTESNVILERWARELAGGKTPPEPPPLDAFGQEIPADYSIVDPTGLPLGPGESVMSRMPSGTQETGFMQDLIDAVYPNMPSGVVPGSAVDISSRLGLMMARARQAVRNRAAENRAKQ